VIATASAANADFVTALGADEVIDYRTTPFETVVRDVDVVLDTVGGDTRDRSWVILSKGGQLVTIAADAERFNQPRVRDAFFIVQPNRVQLIEISRLIEAAEMSGNHLEKPCVVAGRITMFGMQEFGDTNAEPVVLVTHTPATSIKPLIYFVYDPGGFVKNSGGLEMDLSGIHERLKVKVLVVSL
jgi:hypothetical protein